MNFRKILLLFLVIAAHLTSWGQQTLVFDQEPFSVSLIREMEYLVDSGNKYNAANILKSNEFVSGNKSTLSFSPFEHNIWLKARIKSNAAIKNPFISFSSPNISHIYLYRVDSADNLAIIDSSGNAYPFAVRPLPTIAFNFPVYLQGLTEQTYFIHIRSEHPIEVHAELNNFAGVIKDYSNLGLVISLYVGILLSILLYNTFVAIATKDKSYTFYLIYILSLCLAQVTFSGWAFKLFWPNSPGINSFAVIFTTSLTGITGVSFANSFLNISQNNKPVATLLKILIVGYLIAIALSFLGQADYAYLLINYVNLAGGITLLVYCIVLSLKGNRAAMFYLVAWSFFLSGVIISTLKNFNIVPINNFTQYILYIGSSIEAILLSFALADKINTYRKEQSIARQEALRVSKENERLVRDQNIILEKQVHERTQELESTNISLNNTLSQLKEAQSKLVESEKMVSLGQLTAGIAHEINNPINFVVSNVKPLELDISDLMSVIKKYEEIDADKSVTEQIDSIESYKRQIDISYINEEIRTLLDGIKDGANRTAEIVSNLKNFARVDQAHIKFVDLNEGIESTITLIKNTFPQNFVLKKELGNIPEVECMPGKINQVFMNIITNGVQAIAERQAHTPGQGILEIKTYEEKENVKILIKDNGTGMSNEVKEKIFEPFYTTKPVGQGTGLGMSIVKGIIDTHKGLIEVKSNFGDGTEFIITLPINFTA